MLDYTNAAMLVNITPLLDIVMLAQFLNVAHLFKKMFLTLVVSEITLKPNVKLM